MSKRPLVPQSAWQRLTEAAPEEGIQPLKNAKRIRLDLIQTDPRQPRKHFDTAAMDELIASVKQRGILQPITVQKQPDGAYLVVTGERRLRAARAVGLEDIPALVVDLSETDLRLDRVIENRQRKDLTDLEFAQAILEIRADLGAQAPNLSSNELDEYVGERLGLSGRTVRGFAALLNLDPAIGQIMGEKLTEVHTRGLTRVGYDPEMQIALAHAVVEHDLSGRQTLAAAQLLKRNLGLTVPEAVARAQSGKGASAPVPHAPAPPPAAAAPDIGADVEAALAPDDPLRRYWLITTYLGRIGTLLAEPGADEEVALNRQQVSDLGALLKPLVDLHAALQSALSYIARQQQQGDPGYEGEPLPRPLAVMLPYGGAPQKAPRPLRAVKGTAPGTPAPPPVERGKARLQPVPKRRPAETE